jgi:phosphatidylserine/phosphatidylglycerophosphate/cardiolipin synthase-like enzyme
MAEPCFVEGNVDAAPFTLKIHRGEGMVLLAMNWKNGTPPNDFVGFSIEYRRPGTTRFWAVKNRLNFPGKKKPLQPGKPAEQYPSTEAPFQTFRWVHFPRIANLEGDYTWRVTPQFMKQPGKLTPGVAQVASLPIYSETDPGKLNIAFTRGYVSSQAFVDKFGGAKGFKTLIPAKADDGPGFVPTNPKAKAAYEWMGFEARERIVALLDEAIKDGAEVRIVAYELNLPELIQRLSKIGNKLKIIIDDSGDKDGPNSAESKAAAMLTAAGAEVTRQHMGQLQHNKMIVVNGPTVKKVVLGSTNFSWRGFFVQSNNAVIVSGDEIVQQQLDAFDNYWKSTPAKFSASASADWLPLQVDDIDGKVSMCPHSAQHSTQKAIADDMDSAHSSIFYSLAFLASIGGDIKKAVQTATDRADLFVYGVSDTPAGIVLHQLDGNPAPVSAASLSKGLPEPFQVEASGGSGIKMHHKFVVIDFDQPNARVYTGSYNFSATADTKNGENLVLIRDARVARAYMVEALRIFDAYQFRVSFKKPKKPARGAPGAKTYPYGLRLPPAAAGETPWWDKFWSVPIRKRDREMFA